MAAPPIVLLPFRRGYRSAPDEAPHWHRRDYADWAGAVAAAKGYDAVNILAIQRTSMRKTRDREGL